MITCPGDTFTSRAGGAILKALGMPEMICKNIKEYDYKEYMNQFAPVFQDYKLFGFSIAENILLKDADIRSKEEEKEIVYKRRYAFVERLRTFANGSNSCPWR